MLCSAWLDGLARDRVSLSAAAELEPRTVPAAAGGGVPDYESC